MSPSGAARAAVPTPAIDEPTRAWLLDPASPTTRRPDGPRLGLEAPGRPRPTADEPWIRALVGVAADDPTAFHPYQKWRGVHWRLVALAELDADPAEPMIARYIEDGLDRVIAWVRSTSRIRASRAVQGRVRQCASMDGTAAWAATRPGLGDDLLITAIVERLIAWQWPDGGWNCDKRPAASDASFNESLPPLRALAAWSRGRRGRLAGDARAAAERAAEFLLVHRVDRSHRTLELAHPALERLRWPPSAVLALRPAAGAACPTGGRRRCGADAHDPGARGPARGPLTGVALSQPRPACDASRRRALRGSG